MYFEPELFGMGVEEAMRIEYTMEIIRRALEEICLVKNPVAGEAKFSLYPMFKLTSTQR